MVTIHDVVQHDGVPWIVMEYVPGKSLGAAIAKGARLPWERVADIDYVDLRFDDRVYVRPVGKRPRAAAQALKKAQKTKK